VGQEAKSWSQFYEINQMLSTSLIKILVDTVSSLGAKTLEALLMQQKPPEFYS
jgi:hypothetical protein